MNYSVNEIFFTLQGEGVNAGRPAVFCRFAGCNLWSGREADRANAVCQFCDTDFVGVDGEDGGRFDRADQLADAIAATWPRKRTDSEGALAAAAVGPSAASGGGDDDMGVEAAPTPEPMPGFRSGYFRLAEAQRRAGSTRLAARWPWQPFVVLTGGEPLLQCDESLVAALHERGFVVAVETNGTLPAPARLDWVCVSPKAGAPLRLQRGDELKLVFPQPGLSPAELEDLDFDHFLLQPMDGPELEANLAAAANYCRDHRPWQLSLQTHKLFGIR